MMSEKLIFKINDIMRIIECITKSVRWIPAIFVTGVVLWPREKFNIFLFKIKFKSLAIPRNFDQLFFKIVESQLAESFIEQVSL